jgi:site-specific recombinase XerD
MSDLAPVLEGFFAERLTQRRVSRHTVAAYRDTFKLLLRFAQQHLHKTPAALDMADLDADFVGAFLDDLETSRGNSVATRNLRLTAVHSFFTYAALRCPEHAALIQRVLAIPTKRPDRTTISYLTAAETETLLASPDPATRLGRRDHLLLLVAVETGLRVSELTALTCGDTTTAPAAVVHCHGKGRKDRTTPLRTPVARALQSWIRDRGAAPGDALFPTRSGGHLSTDAVADLLAKHIRTAARTCPSLTTKHVTPHTLRHTNAMRLLQAGIDTSVIALWLGHANTRSTQPYLHADLTIKEQALARTAPNRAARARFLPDDDLLAFLERL